MKNIYLIICALFVVSQLSAQKLKDASSDVKGYKRSSLYLVMLEDKEMKEDGKSKVIIETFSNIPIPEKFNDHNLDIRSFDPSAYQVGKDSKIGNSSGKKSSGLGKSMLGAAKKIGAGYSGGLVKANNNDATSIPRGFNNFFKTNSIPNHLIAKWYNVKEEFDNESYFDMSLIEERGLYGASMQDINAAENQIRSKREILSDLGEELIEKTFVVGIQFKYLRKEEVVEKSKSTVKSVMGMALGDGAAEITDAALTGAQALLGGYVVKATAYLYQLDWNENVENIFYEKHWGVTDLDDFYNSKDYRMNFLGQESDWSDVATTIFSKKTEEELIQRATIRSLDQVIAKLQKRFEPFRTTTPLYSADNEITAKIGMKEGLTGGEKFEVLEEILDPETNKSTFKRVCVIKVDKNKIWDNRYGADEEREALAALEESESEGSSEKNKKDEAVLVDATHFTGGNKEVYAGMFIRQID